MRESDRAIGGRNSFSLMLMYCSGGCMLCDVWCVVCGQGPECLGRLVGDMIYMIYMISSKRRTGFESHIWR